MGRPSMRTPELEAEILRRIAEGKSMLAIEADEGMPSRETMRRWCDADPEFRGKFARAREDGAEAHAEAIVQIADDAKDGDSDQIAAARLRIDARKWYASKVAPRKFGDRAAVELSGPEGGPIPQKVAHEFSDEHYAALIRTATAAGFVANGAAHPAPPAPPVGGAAAGSGGVAG